ncbi:hypothetical protein SAMD00079811_14700 [Scytonema sp. HK-05]|nr:hypothetical protein SAMD00079811_14700 [Scytonema sp. HK-05]
MMVWDTRYVTVNSLRLDAWILDLQIVKILHRLSFTQPCVAFFFHAWSPNPFP